MGGGAAPAEWAQAPPGQPHSRCCSRLQKETVHDNCPSTTAGLPQHPVYAVQKPERKQYNVLRVQCHGQVFGRASEVALRQGRKCGDGFLAHGHCPEGPPCGELAPESLPGDYTKQNKSVIAILAPSVRKLAPRLLGTLTVQCRARGLGDPEP